jgi:hypothetical protein
MLARRKKTVQISRIVAGLVLTLATVIAAETAFARGGHRHGGTRVVVGVGFGFGYPFGYPWGSSWGYGYGYPYPYYYPYYPAYYPAPVVPQQQPTVYIEQPQTQQPQTQQPTGYWYYCPTSQAYYPYVRECTVGWQRVAPQPAN